MNEIDESTNFLGKMVDVIMDRPLGSIHPKYKDLYYCTNYGYVPNTMGPDDEEVDAYVLGVFEPIKEFTGRCIAVIKRHDDNDDKLIVVPDGLNFTDEQIKVLTEYQERFFKSYIIREK